MYCMYLRKSREDMDAERHGQGDTLKRHEAMLFSLAKQQNLAIGRVYREVVSGETIHGRPQMQQLLRDVEQGLWAGVLVTEVTRLARGDTMDQGIVAKTFKYSNTRIITPLKTYNPAERSDEEYFEFGLFMSRREYQMINQRLQSGRIRAVMEGKYPGNTPPYGYAIQKLANQKGNTLVIVEEQAKTVRNVFLWYTQGIDGIRLGTTRIAKRLNTLMIPPPKGDRWTTASIQSMLHNPVYIGKVRWNSRKQVKRMQQGQVVISRPRAAEGEYLLIDGLHDPIVTAQEFFLAQELLSRHSALPIPGNRETKNPFCGLIICKCCGRKMVRKPYKDGKALLICTTPDCPTVSTQLALVQRRILDALTPFFAEWEVAFKPLPCCDAVLEEEAALMDMNAKSAECQKMLNAQQQLLEQGVYSIDEYKRRKAAVEQQLQAYEEAARRLDAAIDLQRRKRGIAAMDIPTACSLDALYPSLSPAQQNRVLRAFVERILYTRTAGGRWQEDKGNFILEMVVTNR